MTVLERVEIDAPHRHLRKKFPSDWMAVRAAGKIVVIHEPSDDMTTAYTIADLTKNPRVMAAADAVMWEGAVLKTEYDEELLILQHPFAGIRERLPVNVLLDEAVPTLMCTELVRLKGVGGTVEFECIDCDERITRERNQMDIPGVTPQRCTSCSLDRMGGRR